MTAPHSTQEKTAFNSPSLEGVPAQWREYSQVIVTLVAVAALVATFTAIGALAVILIAPLAGSVAGLGGMLLVWVGGIGFVASIPAFIPALMRRAD